MVKPQPSISGLDPDSIVEVLILWSSRNNGETNPSSIFIVEVLILWSSRNKGEKFRIPAAL